MKKTLILGLLFAVALVLPMASAVNMRVTVIDKYGDSIGNANVEVKNSTDDIICNGLTNGDGKIGNCAVNGGADYKITVTQDNYTQIDDDQTLQNFDSNWVDIAVVMRPKALNLTVHVCAKGDTPDDSCWEDAENVSNAHVTLRSLDYERTDADYGYYYDKMVFPDEQSSYKPFELNKDAYTDENGDAVIEGVDFDTNYELTAGKDGYATTRIGFCYPNIARDATTNINLVEPGTITYRVVVYDDETKGPITDATVIITNIDTLEQQTVQTNSLGKATYTLDTPECYNLTISKDGYTEYTVGGKHEYENCLHRCSGIPGSTPACGFGGEYATCFGKDDGDYASNVYYLESSVLEGEASLTVVVYDQETNELIEGASVVVANNEPGGVVQDGTTDSNGKASFTVDAPACYNITASKDGYAPNTAENQCFEANNDVNLPLFLTQNGSGHEVWNNTISLAAGVWKLVSVPYELINNSVDAVFPLKPPIGTGDNWVLRYNSMGWENPSMTIDPLKGYWVKSDVNATVNLQYKTKSPQDLFPEIELGKGWNMIGHTEDKAQSIEAALYSLYDNGQPTFEIVYRWDGTNWEKYIPGVLAEFNELYPGEGYWIKMKEDWNYTAIDMNTVV